ncbi:MULTISPECIES: DUF1501 domain-containing protein [unclassified Bradyrhizobium]|uniref:DUF1501 domain-containing protein n=1 Tax=unclassified Bradyrhizobium TaxID=2631580 RepID=UPI000BE84A6B|nr:MULTISPECIES: DUF1501 domain-containing protein [unclassified Bradyrhizobium]MBR1201586.1 DUF1501 domain-containing protein [Bradyrhizobium sp. AUGA SZCCT0124]MBR1310742.1 DUF1501 domain-containing protein [Bradyrhizobium sp. AUGA SZCCT0051]MBR1340885.1 DUF1501 domain-containing protein [Bradyrhizobium sp. AUGA SZCCT0105]MBR1355491.1 DUF1501 domain-containing protein [Bradyrhizobium sp. AUGA SZCCT0045]PDT73703.1 hypothetical protein CO675_29320 [Bradyrhizobium sp. C9]
MDRRELIKAFAASASLTLAGRVWAAPATDARLLVVFLRGAYDAANVVVPVGSEFYYASRPTLAVARPDAGNPNAALALDAGWGLHPALRDSIYPLWAKREIAFVPFAGTSDDLSRSHFETQDTIELGQAVGGSRDYRSGFMSRLATELTRVKPISFTDQLPLIFRGQNQIPNIGIASVSKPGVDDRQARLIREMYAKGDLANSVSEGFRVRDDVYKSVSEEMMAANRGAVSPRGFELSARRIGRLMREQFNLGFVDVGGWDTHVNQGAATGYLADRLGELGRGLAGFSEEIGPAMWRDTVVVVISEFGRTFRENGDRGTDHGHGSVYWVMGGGINGGRMAGEQVQVAQATLFQNRDFPVLTDYKAFFAGLIQHVYGLQQASLERIFTGIKPKDLNLV